MFRERTLALESAMKKIPGAKIGDNDDCPLKHVFADGIYCREILIPKGTLLVGKIHRHSHPNFLISGEVSVASERDGVLRIKAPFMWVSPALTKRTIYAHEDTRWVTVHATNETDLEKIEEALIAPTFAEAESKGTP